VDGSCLGPPLIAGFSGFLRNNTSFYLSGFSGYIFNCSDIIYVEIFAIYRGLLLAKELDIMDLVCYSNYLYYINLINGPSLKFHVYVVLIQELKKLKDQRNTTVCQTLREGNQCADFMAKLGDLSDIALLRHASPLEELLNLLQNDAAEIYFLRL